MLQKMLTQNYFCIIIHKFYNLLEIATYLVFLFSQRNALKLIGTQNLQGVE